MTDLLSKSGYTWPGMFKPFDHQRVTAEFLVRNRRSFLLNDIGTAKTLTALWAADFLMKHGAIRKILVAAPLSTLWETWANEIYTHLGHRSYAILHGTKEKRLQMLERDADIYIINHHGFGVVGEDLSRRKDIDLVVVDEGTEFKNSKTDKWRNLNRFAGPQSGRGVWWATGSPMPGGPTDIWAQARIVNPSLVPQYFTRFRNNLMYQAGPYTWLPRRGWEDACYGMLQPSIRFMRDDCIDLPPCTTITKAIPMDKGQADAYLQMFKTFVADLDHGKITAANEGVKRTKLMQMAAGAVYDGEEMTHLLPCTNKCNVLHESIQEAGNKAIVFADYKHSLPMLSEKLTQWGLSHGVVSGSTSTGKRNKIFAEFQNGDLQILLAHPQCMAHGLTLTSSHTVIWWTPAHFKIYEQANGRIIRPSQTQKQTIIHLVCSPIERAAYRRIKMKESLQGLLLDLLKERPL